MQASKKPAWRYHCAPCGPAHHRTAGVVMGARSQRAACVQLLELLELGIIHSYSFELGIIHIIAQEVWSLPTRLLRTLSASSVSPSICVRPGLRRPLCLNRCNAPDSIASQHGPAHVTHRLVAGSQAACEVCQVLAARRSPGADLRDDGLAHSKDPCAAFS